jgi:hypothetical protein
MTIVRRSFLGAGGAGLAIAATPPLARASAVGIPSIQTLPYSVYVDPQGVEWAIGTVGWKAIAEPAANFPYACGMYPSGWHFTGMGGTFVKQRRETALWVIAFGDINTADCNAHFTGVFLTRPGSVEPFNAGAIAIPGAAGQDITYNINNVTAVPPGAATGQWQIGLYAMKTRGSPDDVSTWMLVGATTLHIYEIGLPPEQE